MAKKQLEDWEVAVIRRLLLLGVDNAGQKLFKQDIAFLFSRPRRTINVGRIVEIADDHERYAGIAPATEEEARQFLRDWQEINFPENPILERDLGPTHPKTLAAIFQPRGDDEERIAVSETDTVEGKASFNWGSKEEYGRTMAGFANNRGGYLLFGVEDKTFKIVGIAPDRMPKFDPRKANQYLTRTYNHHLRFEIGDFSIAGKTVGAMYVYQSEHKPIVCKNDDGKLCSGDIYFRYPGETTRIKEPELRKLLEERGHQNEQDIVNILQRIADIGANNSAVIDLTKGTIEGKRGQFVLPTELISQLNFIKDGEFNEQEGAPTLNVVGELKAVPTGSVAIKKVKENLTERDILGDFVEQKEVGNPTEYIERQCHEQARWMPIYYYAHLAGFSHNELADFLKSSSSPYTGRVALHIQRVELDKLPSNIASTREKGHWVADLLSNGTVNIASEEDAISALNAICCFDTDTVDQDYSITLLREVFARFGTNTDAKVRGAFRRACCYLDRAYFRHQLPKAASEE